MSYTYNNFLSLIYLNHTIINKIYNKLIYNTKKNLTDCIKFKFKIDKNKN